MSLLKSAITACEKLATPKDTVICSLSGGADSRFLLEALVSSTLKQNLVVVHINHGLDTESSARAAECEKNIQDLNINFHLLDISAECEKLIKDGNSVETSARQARYDALRNFNPNAIIFVGHHADDQAETLLFRLGRGTGITGAGAMKSKTNVNGLTIARPLLDFRSAKIKEYLVEHNIAWIEDPSNQDADFATRNFIRQKIIPVAEQRIPGFTQNLANAAKLFSEFGELAMEVAQEDFKQCLKDGELNILPMKQLSVVRRKNLLSLLPSMFGQSAPSGAHILNFEKQLFSNDPAGAKIKLGGLHLTFVKGWKIQIVQPNTPKFKIKA